MNFQDLLSLNTSLETLDALSTCRGYVGIVARCLSTASLASCDEERSRWRANAERYHARAGDSFPFHLFA